MPRPVAELLKSESGLSRLGAGAFVYAKPLRPREVEGFLARLREGAVPDLKEADDEACHDARTLALRVTTGDATATSAH